MLLPRWRQWRLDKWRLDVHGLLFIVIPFLAGAGYSLGPAVMSNSAGNRRSPLGLFPGQMTPGLYNCAVESLRPRLCSRTERAYVDWIPRFLVLHDGTHPREMAESDAWRFTMVQDVLEERK